MKHLDRGGQGGVGRSRGAVWWRAARYQFVPPSLFPAALGAALAWLETGRFSAGWYALSLLGVVANHLALNLTDDYFDFLAAADRGPATPFAGGSGVLPAGALGPAQVRRAYRALYGLTAACAAVLTWARGWPVAAFAAFGVLCSYGYTAPPLRYAYRGLGELSQLVNFSLTLGLGSYYVQAGRLSATAAAALLPLGLAMFAMILLNEIPDLAGDRRAGKRTLVVRLGRDRAVALYGGALAAAFGWLVAAVGLGWVSGAALLGLLPAPWALRAWGRARRSGPEPEALVAVQLTTLRLHAALGWGLCAGVLLAGAAVRGRWGPAAWLLVGLAATYLPAAAAVPLGAAPREPEGNIVRDCFQAKKPMSHKEKRKM